MNLSTNGFCQGLRYAVQTSVMPQFSKKACTPLPKMPSLSRNRYSGCTPKGMDSRSCWTTHFIAGYLVIAKCITLRRPWSKTRKTYNVAKLMVVTVKKSIAHEASRWLRRNGSHVVDFLRGFRGLNMYLHIVSSHGGSYWRRISVSLILSGLHKGFSLLSL